MGRRAGVTHHGTTAGTPAFLAPELATGEGEVDGRADLYALGCVAHWLVAGRLVFDAPTPPAMLVAHARDRPAPLSEVAEVEVPPDLEALVMACLEKEPADRPPSAAAVGAALGDLARAWTRERAEHWWRVHKLLP